MRPRIAVIGAITFLAACSGAAASAPAWIVNAAMLARVEAIAPELVFKTFNNNGVFETTNSALAPGTDHAIVTMSFGDETALANAVESGSLVPGTRALIYDNENWSRTPRAQQLDPATYYQLAAQVAHQHGLLLIAAPGTNLAGVIVPGATGMSRFDEYLRLGIPQMAARYADIFAIQAQALEPNPTLYSQFVDNAAAQARWANSRVEVIAALSTNPSLPPVEVEPASVLLDAALASRSAVSGWWLNDPGQGPQCPLCVGPFPQTVVDFLNGLASLPPTTLPPPSTSGSIQPPVLSALNLFPREFRAAHAGKSVTTSPTVGTKVHFKLNVPASVRFTVTRRTEGRRVGSRCRTLEPKNRTMPHCKYWKALKGAFTINGKAGDNNFRFSGRFNRVMLGVGVYRFIVIPTANGGKGSAHFISFTIVRR